jgi:hypothetical protein
MLGFSMCSQLLQAQQPAGAKQGVSQGPEPATVDSPASFWDKYDPLKELLEPEMPLAANWSDTASEVRAGVLASLAESDWLLNVACTFVQRGTPPRAASY